MSVKSKDATPIVDSELSLNVFNEGQAANRERLGPSIISPRQLTPKRLGDLVPKHLMQVAAVTHSENSLNSKFRS